MQVQTVGPESGAVILTVVVAFVVLTLVELYLVRRLLVICRPSELVVISGRPHRLPDGSIVGYRILSGGRAFRIPVVEQVARMDRRLIPVEVGLQEAYANNGVPLLVSVRAWVKVSSNPKLMRNAVERLLSRAPHEIGYVAAMQRAQPDPREGWFASGQPGGSEPPWKK